MADDEAERAGYAIYQEFIRYGFGTCMERVVNGNKIPETPEQACTRRWRRLTERIRNQFIAEARAADLSTREKQ